MSNSKIQVPYTTVWNKKKRNHVVELKDESVDEFIKAYRRTESNPGRDALLARFPQFKSLTLEDVSGDLRGQKLDRDRLAQILFSKLRSEGQKRQDVLKAVESAQDRKQMDAYWTDLVNLLGDKIIVGVEKTGNAKLYSRVQTRFERQEVA